MLSIHRRRTTAGQVGGDLGASRAALEEQVQLARELGNSYMSGMALFSLGALAAFSDDGVTARARLEESAALFAEMQDRCFLNVTRSELAHLLRRQGQDAAAVALYDDTIGRWLELGNRAALAHQLEALAFLTAEGHQRAGALRAARLLGTAVPLRAATQTVMTAMEREEYARAVTAIRAELDEATFAAALAEGRAMPVEQAIAYALAETGRTAAAGGAGTPARLASSCCGCRDRRTCSVFR